jgi:hypothetical protein
MPAKLHKDLYSCHEEYCPTLNEKLCLLYQGGFAIQQNAQLFLDRLEGLESPKAYQRRLKCTAYIPYLSEFITQFGASLFSEELEVKPPGDAEDGSTQGDEMQDDFYKMFIQDCDLNGKSLHQFMQDVFECALHQMKVYVGMDFPKANKQPINRLEEKMMGLSKGYLYTIPYDNVIDWKKDERTHKYIWLKIFEECFPDDDPMVEAKHYFQFKIWTVKDGKGFWQLWESELMPLTKTYNANTKYTMKDEGAVSFPEVPVFDFHIPKGYHVGLQIGSLCQEHYQRRSFMVSNANKTCVSLGVITLGPDVGSPGDSTPPDIETMETPTALRTKLETDGWVVLRQTDKWADKAEIIEAKGESHKFIAEELRHLVESMMQTLRQMNMTATANQKAVGRSAASKSIDQHGTSMLLSVYDRRVKDFVKKLFTCLSAGRKEDIAWVVDGLSIAEPVMERKDLIEEVTKMGIEFQSFPKMFKNKYIYRLANELLDNNLSDKEKMELQEKVEESVEKGDFDSFDAEEAKAAGNRMAPVTASHEGGDQSSAPPSQHPKDMPVGQNGMPDAPEGRHLATGAHVDSEKVYDQLKGDYDDKYISWIKDHLWEDQKNVPLSSIDYSNMSNWEATQRPEKVKEFMDKIKNDNFDKPIILANVPLDNSKMHILDGHTRAIAYLKLGLPIPAYVTQVPKLAKEMQEMHSMQRMGEAGGNRIVSQQVSSNQN